MIDKNSSEELGQGSEFEMQNLKENTSFWPEQKAYQ